MSIGKYALMIPPGLTRCREISYIAVVNNRSQAATIYSIQRREKKTVAPIPARRSIACWWKKYCRDKRRLLQPMNL